MAAQAMGGCVEILKPLPGEGPIFTDPDPDAARSFFKIKTRVKKNKTMSLKEAVKKFVNDGDYLGIGGFGANRTPVAACHEIVRQKKKNLGFAGHTSTHEYKVESSGAWLIYLLECKRMISNTGPGL